MVRVQVTAGRCGSGPPLLLPVTRWPVPWSLDRTVAGDTLPSWGLCLRPHRESASPGAPGLSLPFSGPFTGQSPTRGQGPCSTFLVSGPDSSSEAECEGCAFPDEAGKEAVLGCERHRPPAPPHVTQAASP